MKNWHLKLGSLLAATLLALFVNYFFSPTDYGTSVVQLIAPVEIRNVPENKSVLWPTTRQVELTVQGSSLFISKVALSPPVVRVVMPEGAQKGFSVTLTADNVSLPATVKLLGIKPAELEFGLDEIVEKTLPVVVPQIGQLLSDLKLEKVKIVPSEVKIKGPSRELKSVGSIESNPLNLATIENNKEVELELRSSWALVEPKDKLIRVAVEVVEASGEVSFSNVPVNLVIEDESLKQRNPQISQKAVAVIVRAPKKVLRTINKESLVVKAQISREDQLKDLIELSIEPIVNVDSMVISPRKIQISVDPLVTATVTPVAKKSISKAAPNKK